jgi:hypothetical protein
MDFLGRFGGHFGVGDAVEQEGGCLELVAFVAGIAGGMDQGLEGRGE